MHHQHKQKHRRIDSSRRTSSGRELWKGIMVAWGTSKAILNGYKISHGTEEAARPGLQPHQPVRDEGGVDFSKKPSEIKILTDFGSSGLFTTWSISPVRMRERERGREGGRERYILREI